MSAQTIPSSASACMDCGTEIAPLLLSCPGCGRFIHAEKLKELSKKAEESTVAGDLNAALAHWTSTLDLLPPDCGQYAVLQAKRSALSAQGAAESRTKPMEEGLSVGSSRRSGLWKIAAGVTSLILIIAGKAKFLLLGFTKAGTVFSMALSLGVYWTAWGWSFALGLVISMYIHEMGHVAALARYGIPAGAPTFVPGLGAFVRMKQHPATPGQDARVGLAGPVWGLGAALGAYFISIAIPSGPWAAIARVGAWINLLNLIPIWQLDGSRAFRALSRSQRWMIVLVTAGMYAMTAQGLLIVVVLIAALRGLEAAAPVEDDSGALSLYVLLIIVLAAMCSIGVAVP